MTSPVIGPVPRPDSPNVHCPLPTTTTTTSATTTTTLPLPPQLQQGPLDPIIIKCMGELEELIANLVEENQALEERLDKQGSRINKLEAMNLPKMIREQTVEFIDSQEIDRKINESVKEVVISSVKHAMRAPLRARFKDLPTSDMKEILLQCMLEENYDKGHAVHRVAYEALQDSICRDECEDFDVDKAQEETKKKSKQDSPKTPSGSAPSPPPPPPPPSGASGASGTTGASDSAQAPPPPPPSSSTHQGGQSTSTVAPSSSKTATLAEYSAWTTTDTRIKPSITTIPDDLYIDDETTTDEQAYSSGEEVGRDHIPIVNLRQSWWKPLTKDRHASPEPAWTIPSSDLPVPTNNWASALKTTYVPPPENSLLAQTSDIATFMDWYCKQQGISELTPKDLEGPAYGIVKAFHPDIGQPALSISKMKAVFYPDVGLEQLTQLNLTKPRWDATGFEFKHDYTVIDSPRAVTFRDRYGVQMIMRFNEIHKFSDGTLQQIDEALDYRVKEFRVNRTNPGMNTRFWTKKDVVRSKEFMFAIQKRLKTRRIFRNLESFVGGRIREGDYRLLKRTE
ncbi:hypothetical protein Tco_1078989 [Tanacetum coccineum]|uniref:Uncharacterized protein n=1 Tax=Tanacetum coccineum TaxID=301880 RepID=A0ABQ5HQP2_9ASTR